MEDIKEITLNLIYGPTYAFIRKNNSTCTLHIDYGSYKLESATIGTILGTIPIGYRPSKGIQYKIGHNGFRFTVLTNGEITVSQLPLITEHFSTATYINISYIV